MSEIRNSTLSSSEVQQLFQSLQSRSIREVALTVCTIRSLASEVKCILRDLLHDEVPAPLPSPRMHENSSFGMLGITPPTTFSPTSNMSTDLPRLSAQPYSSLQRSSGFSQLLAKRGRRRHKCHHCPRTFSAQASVWRHIRSHHSSKASLPNPPTLTSVDNTDNAANMFNLPDTSVSTPKEVPHAMDDSVNLVAVVTPVTSPQAAPSPDGHLSPMPTIADMFNAERVKPEPDESMNHTPLEVDAETTLESPSKTLQEYSAELDVSHSMSSLFPPSSNSSNDNELQIRASVDAQLMEIPADGMYQCSDCLWRSKSADTMRAHMLSHKGILPFSCTICNYKTNKKHVLTRHYTVHTGEKPHKCPICSFGSLDHVELLKHMTKTHPGVHPFTCTVCGHHATTNTLLKKHMKLMHSMSIRKQQSPSSDAHALSSSSNKFKAVRNVVNSASETIYSSDSNLMSQPIFP
ncbi:hypothetical protein EB796_024823 [Bugula neritina]|uniref:C2H2-type domain-containing protein n=1 Tax=Bugula neritina TaxID=10212 RepID=A0A7J7ISK5_BUGNE|nr:hypothetical protein EB796_024823 [Bugula neritina]